MFSSIRQIENYLLQLVPDSAHLHFPAGEGIARTKEFLKLLGTPQDSYKIIHVAGTSGKGSTSFMISNLLTNVGFKVGLSLSPHLLDIRERVEINNNFISSEKYIQYFTEIMPVIEKMKHSSHGKITYFEAMVGMTYYSFYKEKVDYAVIETGLGGEFDGTNVVSRGDKLSVLSRIGFDHMKVLGNSLTEIAHQKAMICAQKGEMITIYQFPTAFREIQKVASQKQARLFSVEKKTMSNIRLSRKNTSFSFHWRSHIYKNITSGLLGVHQVQNASLALAAVCHLSERDRFPLTTQTVISTFQMLRFKGRFDILTFGDSQIILDGAHNMPKMKALLTTLKSLSFNQKLTFVLAFKKGKEYKKMIRLIIPYADKIIITHIFSKNQDLFHFSVSPQIIVEEITKLGFANARVVQNINEIIHIMKHQKTTYIISGSLYLLGDIYKQIEKKQ